jgi:hypothetical protein
MKTTTKPQAGDRVTFSHPSVLKGKTMQGVIERDDFEGMLVFMPDEAHHPELAAAFLEPEAGLFLDGATLA